MATVIKKEKKFFVGGVPSYSLTKKLTIMEKYNCLHAALKDDWKIGRIFFDMEIREFCITVYKKGYGVDWIDFFVKNIPSYLKNEHFMEDIIDTDWNCIQMNLYLLREE